MKTTIDLPEPLYKQAKIRAIERGQSLKDLIVNSLTKELAAPEPTPPASETSFWARRKLLPEYEAAMKAGAYRPATGDRDITDLISEDRDAR
jgi:hypothetical protein